MFLAMEILMLNMLKLTWDINKGLIGNKEVKAGEIEDKDRFQIVWGQGQTEGQDQEGGPHLTRDQDQTTDHNHIGDQVDLQGDTGQEIIKKEIIK